MLLHHRSIINSVVYQGIALMITLVRHGVEILEVYPYAVKVTLCGKPIPPQTTAPGLNSLRQRLKNLVPGVDSHPENLNHDLCDAIPAACTAYLHSHGETEILEIEEGALIVPGGGSMDLPTRPLPSQELSS